MASRRIVQADAVFEAALGFVLVVGATAGWLGAGDFPAPVGTVAVIVLLGCALLVVGAVLWRLASGAVPARLLRILATANLATAAAALAWWLAATGFSTAGSAVTLTTVGVLAILGAAQLRAATLAAAAGPGGVATGPL